VRCFGVFGEFSAS